MLGGISDVKEGRVKGMLGGISEGRVKGMEGRVKGLLGGISYVKEGLRVCWVVLFM